MGFLSCFCDLYLTLTMFLPFCVFLGFFSGFTLTMLLSFCAPDWAIFESMTDTYLGVLLKLWSGVQSKLPVVSGFCLIFWSLFTSCFRFSFADSFASLSFLWLALAMFMLFCFPHWAIFEALAETLLNSLTLGMIEILDRKVDGNVEMNILRFVVSVDRFLRSWIWYREERPNIADISLRFIGWVALDADFDFLVQPGGILDPGGINSAPAADITWGAWKQNYLYWSGFLHISKESDYVYNAKPRW